MTDERWEEILEYNKLGDPLKDIGVDEDELVSEIIRLREIVSQIPKTADGVPVYRNMTVWFPSYHYGSVMPLDAFAFGSFARARWGGTFHVSKTYSTKEAAKSAPLPKKD